MNGDVKPRRCSGDALLHGQHDSTCFGGRGGGSNVNFNSNRMTLHRVAMMGALIRDSLHGTQALRMPSRAPAGAARPQRRQSCLTATVAP